MARATSVAAVRETIGAVPYGPSSLRLAAPATYEHGPDSMRSTDVAAGDIEMLHFAESAIYPTTTRTVHVYRPAGSPSTEQLPLMVFQDGSMYLDPDDEMRVQIVLDNLIHAGDIPPMVAVFVDPGQPANRNVEYDAADDRYARFLIDEVIPVVATRHPIASDPDQWAICGGSSGGKCAFTVAWQRPDRFRRVLTFVASFAQVPGGTPTPT